MKRLRQIAVVAALGATLAGEAKAMPYPVPPQVAETKRPLACWVDEFYRLDVGSAYALPKGTPISFKAKLAEYPYSHYDRTIPLPEDIIAHLWVTLSRPPYIPKLAGYCEAWWVQPPVVAPRSLRKKSGKAIEYGE
jgi:hypothetical protein